MSREDPIDLLFGGMEQLGPGSNADTLKVLDTLPRASHQTIVDAGCGTGRQTLALAGRLRTLVHAVDSHAPFLADLDRRAQAAGIESFVRSHCMDMADIPSAFPQIDLLWSEGAAYGIGFRNALETWHSALASDGFLVVSELAWMRDEIPLEVRQFFESEYPDMRSVDQNRVVIGEAGYEILATHTLPSETWVKGYYDILEPRAKALLDHPDATVREFASAMIEEIRIFRCSEDSYGYVFYAMKKA